MEGAHLSSSTDPENIFDTSTKKEKKKKVDFESEPTKEVLEARRHVAQEAMKLEQSQGLFEGFSQKTPEKEQPNEMTSELTPDERQYAAQILRRESRLQRHESTPEPDIPPAVIAGDLLVEEWDERIESGEDMDAAFAQVLETHHIETPTGDVLNENVPQQELASDATKHEFPLFFGEQEGAIDRAPQPPPSAQSPQFEGYTKHSTDSSTQDFETDTLKSESSSADIDWEATTDDTAQTQPTSVKSDAPRRTYYDQAKPAPTYIRNGIVGNFMGSRRGQIKDEKKLLPIQRNLEQAVNDLSWELKAKEAKIRHAAAEFIQTKGPDALEPLKQQVVRAREAILERVPISNYSESRDPSASRERAPEARQLHGDPETQEHLGHVIVSAESAEPKKAPSAEVQPDDRMKLPENKRVESMSRPELLELSSHIEVDGTTLRNVYETHLIGEQALRRLVAEHLNGGNVARALKREIVEHEIDFERDPALRDMAIPGEGESKESSKVVAPGKEALNQLLQKAGENISDSEDPLNYPKAVEKVPEKEAETIQDNSTMKRTPNRRRVDVIMGSTILALVIAIIILYLWRM